MRLKLEEVSAIKAAAHEAFGSQAIVRLFGSRIDDKKRGGDIDLHVELPDADPLARAEIRFRTLLFDILDEEPVDVVVHSAGVPRRWIDEIALRDGMIL